MSQREEFALELDKHFDQVVCQYLDQSGDTIGEWQREELDLSYGVGRSFSLEEPRFEIINRQPTQTLTTVGLILDENNSLDENRCVSHPDLPSQSKPVNSGEQNTTSEQPKPSNPTITITIDDASISNHQPEKTVMSINCHLASLQSFLQLNQENYKPHLFNLKEVYFLAKNYARSSLEMLRNCRMYFQARIKSERNRLSSFKSKTQSNPPGSQQIYKEIYVDQKIVIASMLEIADVRKENCEELCNLLATVLERMQEVENTVSQQRQKREQYLEKNLIQVADRIGAEIEEMASSRLENRLEDELNTKIRLRLGNPYFKKDKYLQIKYLMQREESYLRIIKCFNMKLVAYLMNLFQKEEIIIHRLVSASLTKFFKLSGEVWTNLGSQDAIKSEGINPSPIKDREDFQKQLFGILRQFIPNELYEHQGKESVDGLLCGLNSHLQNVIFMSTIEMMPECILMKFDGIWSKNHYQHSEQTCLTILNNNSARENYDTSSIISTKRDILKQDKNKIQVTGVLSSNLYLHLENKEKLATLKLKETKVTKKGHSIILSEKRKGLSGLISSERELGRIQFLNCEDIDLFVIRIKEALGREAK